MCACCLEEVSVCMYVCLSTGDMADRTTNSVGENIQSNECKLLSLGTAFLFCKNRMGALGPNKSSYWFHLTANSTESPVW